MSLPQKRAPTDATTFPGLPKIYTPQEVADYLGIPITQLTAMRRRKEGPKPLRVGWTCIRYSAEEIERYLVDLRCQRGIREETLVRW